MGSVGNGSIGDRLYVLPKDPILVKFGQVLERANGPMIRDSYGFDKDYYQLLGDALETRDRILKSLPSTDVDENGFLQTENPYICVLALSGYEFLVAFFAIRALNGACVPFGSGILPEEAQYFLENTNSACLLVGQNKRDHALKVATHVQGTSGRSIATPDISVHAGPLDQHHIDFSETVKVEPSSPGLVLFTSGSTGPPKGAVLPKECFNFKYTGEPQSATLGYRPSNWVGGAESLIEAVVTGTKLFSLKERSGADAVWEVFRRNELTHVLFTPTLLRTMKDYYLQHVSKLADAERDAYVRGFCKMTKISCCSAMLAPSVLRFWTALTGLPFENVYGSTEMGGAVMRARTDTTVQFSIGAPCPGVEVKLSNGVQGEIHARSSWMLTHYIGNEKATRSAFDDEGFFKTGDLAELVKGEHVFTGRATSDYIFFHGYRIAILPVENHITDLPYIAEACVLGIPDHEAKQLCGVVVRTSQDLSEPLTLERLRIDLASHLPTYMLPALLRVMADGEEIPRTVSQKPIKKQILGKFFGVEDYWPAENPTPGVQTCGNLPPQRESQTRPWDWCGLQRGDAS